MDGTPECQEALLTYIADMIGRSEKAQAKFAVGTAQHTLQKNRLHALHVAAALVRQALTGGSALGEYNQEDLEKARAPLASLLSKSEKAQQKLTPGTWQQTMLSHNIAALRAATGLLTAALA